MKYYIRRLIFSFILLSAITVWGVEPLPFPKMHSYSMRNGLKVVLIQQREQPILRFTMLFNAGTLQDLKGKEGTAELVAALLDQGTQAHSSDAIAKTIESVGGSLGASAGKTAITVSCRVLKWHESTGLSLFSDIIRNPAFRKKEFKRVQHQFKTNLKENVEDNNWLLDSYTNHVLFGPESAWGRTQTARSLKQLSIQDLQHYYATHFLPNNATLVVVGDLEFDAIKKTIKHYFSSWEPGKVYTYTQAKTPKKAKLLFIDKPGQTQANLALVHFGTPLHSPLYPAFRLLNYCLGGGGFSSALMKAVRSERGQTYSIYSYSRTYPDLTIHAIKTFSRNKQLPSVIDTIDTVLTQLQDKNFSAETLEKAKSFYKGYLPIQFEDPSTVSSWVINGLHKGLTLSQIQSQYEALLEAKSETVHELLKTMFSFDQFSMIIVGDHHQLKESLAHFQPYDVVYYKAISKR